MEITGHVFVVTGGGNGIGREVVLGLLARGARVHAVDRDAAGLADTAALAAVGDRLATTVIDLTDRSEVLDLPDTVIATHGQVDGLINVAGIVHDFTPVAQLPFEAIERVMAVNFWGTVHTTKAFLPHLEARPAAALVNVSSMGALTPFPGQSAYGASKAAVKLFTEGLIAEHRTGPLNVSIVFPGGVATDILGNSGVEGPAMSAEAAAKASRSLTSAPEAARQIIEAVATGRPRVVIGRDARSLDRLSRLMPARAIPIIAKKMAAVLGG
jgi:NAD(P)-dependent dehydrogenase (short-subunit alcohol dehydrogenase family)